MDWPGPEASKEDLRSWARAARVEIDWEAVSADVIAGLRDWPPLALAGVALVFLPLPDEVNLNPLLESFVGPTFVATRTPASGSLTVHELGGPLEVHDFGFLQPHSSAREVAVDAIDVFLLPGLAFDLWGVRLGRGRGYFDELLAGARRGATKVGVVPARLVVDRLPRDRHDVLVDYLATDEGVIPVASVES